MRGYVLSAVVYIPYEGDPYREERLKEMKRVEELYELLKKSCSSVKVDRTGLFGVEALFEKCTVDLPPEKGDLYTLEPY